MENQNDFNKQMRKEEFIFNLVSRSFIALLILVIFLMLTYCGGLCPDARYAKEHKNNNFAYRLNANESFTFKSAKDDFRTAKKEIKADNKKERQDAKVSAMRDRINQLKNNQ